MGDALLDRGHRCIIAGFAQAGQIALRECLVLALQGLGEGDIFEQALCPQFLQGQRRFAFCPAAAVDRSNRDIVETLCPSGAEIEDAGLFRMVEKEEISRDEIRELRALLDEAEKKTSTRKRS